MASSPDADRFYLHDTASVVAALCSIPYPVLTVSVDCLHFQSVDTHSVLLGVLPASVPAAYSPRRVS